MISQGTENQKAELVEVKMATILGVEYWTMRGPQHCKLHPSLPIIFIPW